MKTIFLEDKYHPITISNETFEMVKELVITNRVCGTCGRRFVDRCPCVALNLCLECLQKKYAHKKLTYVDVLTFPGSLQSDYTTHQFVDPGGYIHLSGTSSDSEPNRSVYYTLLYWSFPVPLTIQRDGKEVQLSTYYWSIYGDIKHNPVLYIQHSPHHADAKSVAFLSFKNGAYKEINKRQKYFQNLFKEARAKLEQSRDERGYYHINGQEVYGIYDAYIYEGVAELASSEYDQQRQRVADKAEHQFIEDGMTERHEQLPWNREEDEWT